jgi:hypothetical protein
MEATGRHDYSENKLEFDNMLINPRCNVAGPLGQLIPTRSWLALLLAKLASACRLRR